jgi:hypothetical protein
VSDSAHIKSCHRLNNPSHITCEFCTCSLRPFSSSWAIGIEGGGQNQPLQDAGSDSSATAPTVSPSCVIQSPESVTSRSQSRPEPPSSSGFQILPQPLAILAGMILSQSATIASSPILPGAGAALPAVPTMIPQSVALLGGLNQQMGAAGQMLALPLDEAHLIALERQLTLLNGSSYGLVTQNLWLFLAIFF